MERLKKRGYTIPAIASMLDLPITRVREKIGKRQFHNTKQISRETLARRKAQIPKDTRDFTGRFCGDPLPGRSALDRMRQEGSEL